MQLPRVVIAAVFFVIGALIAVPTVVDWWSPSSASSPTESGTTTSPTASPTGASPSGSATRSATASPSPSRSASPGPTPTASAAQPLRVSIGSVQCPDGEVEVTIRNTGPQTVDYAIEKNDDTGAVPGRIGAGSTRTTTVDLREDRRTAIEVTYRNRTVETERVTANCRRSQAAPPDDELPRTGADGAVLWARAATGGAVMVTGLIIFWYGGIWPRRREEIFAKKNAD